MAAPSSITHSASAKNSNYIRLLLLLVVTREHKKTSDLQSLKEGEEIVEASFESWLGLDPLSKPWREGLSCFCFGSPHVSSFPSVLPVSIFLVWLPRIFIRFVEFASRFDSIKVALIFLFFSSLCSPLFLVLAFQILRLRVIIGR